MNWVKQKYDIVILAVATLLLVSNAGWIVMNRMEQSAVQASLIVPKENAIPALSLDAVRQAAALTDSPAKWKSGSDLPKGTPERGSLLVSRRYLLKDGKLIDPLSEGSEQLHPPITNDWLLANGLDYTDMNIKEKDSDGDGFSNLEEFEKKTNPNDPKDAPASFNKLKLVSFNSVPFLLTFKSLSKEEIILKKENNKDESSSKKATINFSPADWNINNENLGKYFKETINGTKNEYKNKIEKNEDEIKKLEKQVEKLEKFLLQEKVKAEKVKADKDTSRKIKDKIDGILSDLKKASNDLMRLPNLIETDKKSLDLLNEIFPEEIEVNISITKTLPSPKSPEIIQFENDGRKAVLEIDREFQINFISPEKNVPSQYLKLGNQIEGAPYRILKYEAKPGPNGVNASGDLSELTVQNTETGESIVLVYNKEANDPTSYGTFRNLLAPGDADFTLKKGEEFTIKPDITRKLKLIDITATKAQIRDISTGDIFSVLSNDSSSL